MSLIARKIHKSFVSSEGESIEVLRGVSLECARGKTTGLIGPNGAGKTTLLRILATLLQPDQGEAFIEGLSLRENPALVRRKISFLTNTAELYRRLTVRETLEFFSRLHGLPPKVFQQQLKRLTDELDLADFLDRRGDRLSTGMKQRAALARAILHDPPVLILDEPTNGLDILATQRILAFLRERQREGKTILFSSHHLTEVEELSQQVIFLGKGEILARGSLSEILETTGQATFSQAVNHLYPASTP
ncbi:MAG: ATP-binding cassette domain-containing protein [Opitutales bacterium]|nr:ATP-binding cassette domain-containing protein [Opitutales bacterium]MCH8541382.1 ATP-binding cassette domain-containing protein [Opitutales bacterium]